MIALPLSGETMRKMITVMTGCLLMGGSSLVAQGAKKQADATKAAPADKAKGMSTEAKIKLASSAAPADIGKDAAVFEAGENGAMKELRAGTNGWMCMAEPEAMCIDKQWQGWADAWMNKKDPQIQGLGVAYMLKGDKGASNTDPFATGPTSTNEWVVSPSHVMILTSDANQLNTLSTDPHNGGPWVMWKGSKYAHIMVPLVPMPTAKATKKK
jgi:hypothetical protein